MTADAEERWEIVRRQVALSGRVSLPDTGRAPDDFEVWLAAEPPARMTTATVRPNGIFFFLDLPAGDYTVVAAAGGGRWRGEGAGTVAWDATGRVLPAVVNVELTRRK